MNNIKKIFYIIIVLLTSTFCLWVYFVHPKTQAVCQKKSYFHTLEQLIKVKQKSFDGDFSFFVKDFSFPQLELSFQSEEKIAAASIIKLPILAVMMRAVKENKFSLDDEIIIKRKDITGGSGKIKGMKIPIKLTLRKILELMITRSDNTATNKVIDLLGYDYINNDFTQLGLTDTFLKRKMMDFSLRSKGVENYTTARDITLLFEKLYTKKLVDKSSSELMISLLKKQKVNNRIPRFLPEGVIVAHKTGLERGVVHDAGIVFNEKGDYIICVLVNKVKNFNNAKKLIAQLSLLTYNLY
ncbi:MAG: serine hydrolase [Candidatus Omnitrophica bacterium]|nr:serine hydrolase [Candidatus Omnitrophota bacterium]